MESSGANVDLIGFSLTGDLFGGDYGIHVAGSTNAVIDKVVIRGGTISGFYYEHANNSRIERCLVSGNKSQGVYLWASTASAMGTRLRIVPSPGI